MAKYGMIIDLGTCFRCRTCMVACKVVNKIPTVFDYKSDKEYYRMRPVEWEEGKYPNVRRLSIPVACMHCDDPACMAVCPVDAISKRPDGIVVVDKDQCIGCEACMEACPYGAPYLRGEKADRCDFCNDRLKQGLEPYCVETCPCNSMVFGDLNDSSSEVAQRVAAGEARPLMPEAKTKPNVYYVPPLWYKAEWGELSMNDTFLKAMAEREKDR